MLSTDISHICTYSEVDDMVAACAMTGGQAPEE